MELFISFETYQIYFSLSALNLIRKCWCLDASIPILWAF